MKLCDQKVHGGTALNKQTTGNVSVYYTRIACRFCVWLSARIACYNVLALKGAFAEMGNGTHRQLVPQLRAGGDP